MRGSTGGTGRMLSRGEGEAGRRTGGGGKKAEWREGGRQGAAICQTRQTYPPPSNLRYSVCLFLSSFRHRDQPRDGGEVVGHLDKPISPTPIV